MPEMEAIFIKREEPDVQYDSPYVIKEQCESEEAEQQQQAAGVDKSQIEFTINDSIEIGPVKIEEDTISEPMDSGDSQKIQQLSTTKLLTKKTCKKRREKAKQWRENLKNNPLKLEEFRLKESERKQKYRKRQTELSKTNNILLKERREKNRIRQRRHREKKRNAAQIKKQCMEKLEKDIMKVEDSLPMEVEKKVQIIEFLYKKYVCPRNEVKEMN